MYLHQKKITQKLTFNTYEILWNNKPTIPLSTFVWIIAIPTQKCTKGKETKYERVKMCNTVIKYETIILFQIALDEFQQSVKKLKKKKST